MTSRKTFSMDKISLCRHCGAKLTQITGTDLWEDADRIMVCIKMPLLQPRSEVEYVLHVPMPEGFRGAPGTIR